MTTQNFLGIDRSKEYIKAQTGALTVQLIVVALAMYMLYTVKAEKALITVLTIGTAVSALLVVITCLYLIIKGPENGQRTIAVLATVMTAIFAAFSFGRFVNSNSSVAYHYSTLAIAVAIGAICIILRPSRAKGVKVRAINEPARNISSLKPIQPNSKAGRLAPPAQLTKVNSDATVGLHIKYDSLDIPKLSWANDFIGMMDLQVQVREAVQKIHSPWYLNDNPAEPPKDAPNGIMLLGDPGNGKTFIPSVVAGNFGYPLFTLTADDVASQWVGETNKALAVSFEMIKHNCPCVLFIDEIDSFVTKRGGNTGSAADRDAERTVNIFLTQLVELRKFPVIIMAATNLEDQIDTAVARVGRFDFKISVGNPDFEARKGLLINAIEKHVPGVDKDTEAIVRAAKKFNGFNVKQILEIGRRVPDVLAKQKLSLVSYEVVMAALREVQGTKGRIPENALTMSELVMPSSTRKHVESLLEDMRNVSMIEEFGGDIPRGVVFHGPGGTGKTSVAKTLAKESGWGFVSTTGPDLVSKPGELEKCYSKAMALRPCILFIDEADDVLRDRAYSKYSEVTNKLLTIMEGVDDAVKDVIFMAATNNPDMIDPVLVRTGRFTGKIEFTLPGIEEKVRLINIWEGRNPKVIIIDRAALDEYVGSIDISQANLNGLLQNGLNNAIREKSFNDGHVHILMEHISSAQEFISI
ncbi:AAA family ATPase [Comamonas testosteroni]|uniref:AAA family ATPase n=1 Tax=Comamonas testosteroni TaxID=285 RepID=UPI0005B311C3|nr:AAA family ATPase [Comamonas testosteroni]